MRMKSTIDIRKPDTSFIKYNNDAGQYKCNYLYT